MRPAIGMTMLYKGKEIIHITGGSYMGNHGVSNYWHFRKVKPDRTLSKKERGDYDNVAGKFMEIEGVETRLIIPEPLRIIGHQSDWDAHPRFKG
jgi:hypothetical protein